MQVCKHSNWRPVGLNHAICAQPFSAANARAEQVERTSNSEAAMERPSSRAVTTAFVPR